MTSKDRVDFPGALDQASSCWKVLASDFLYLRIGSASARPLHTCGALFLTYLGSQSDIEANKGDVEKASKLLICNVQISLPILDDPRR